MKKKSFRIEGGSRKDAHKNMSNHSKNTVCVIKKAYTKFNIPNSIQWAKQFFKKNLQKINENFSCYFGIIFARAQ